MLRMIVAGLDDGGNNRTVALAGVKAACLTRLQGAGRDTADLAQLINECEPAAALRAGQTSSAVFWHPTGCLGSYDVDHDTPVGLCALGWTEVTVLAGGMGVVVADLGVEPGVQGGAELGVAGGVGGACSVRGVLELDGDPPAVRSE